jgi:hypothetical protein
MHRTIRFPAVVADPNVAVTVVELLAGVVGLLPDLTQVAATVPSSDA